MGVISPGDWSAWTVMETAKGAAALDWAKSDDERARAATQPVNDNRILFPLVGRGSCRAVRFSVIDPGARREPCPTRANVARRIGLERKRRIVAGIETSRGRRVK